MNAESVKRLKKVADYYGRTNKVIELGNAAYDLYTACINAYEVAPTTDEDAKAGAQASYNFCSDSLESIIANIAVVKTLIAQVKYLFNIDSDVINFLQEFKLYVEDMKIQEQEAELNGKDNKQTAQRNS